MIEDAEAGKEDSYSAFLDQPAGLPSCPRANARSSVVSLEEGHTQQDWMGHNCTRACSCFDFLGHISTWLGRTQRSQLLRLCCCGLTLPAWPSEYPGHTSSVPWHGGHHCCGVDGGVCLLRGAHRSLTEPVSWGPQNPAFPIPYAIHFPPWAQVECCGGLAP